MMAVFSTWRESCSSTKKALMFPGRKVHSQTGWMVQSAWPTWSYGSTSWTFANV
jgi:hypothetical protein